MDLRTMSTLHAIRSPLATALIVEERPEWFIVDDATG
jgi:hypothetical protein